MDEIYNTVDQNLMLLKSVSTSKSSELSGNQSEDSISDDDECNFSDEIDVFSSPASLLESLNSQILPRLKQGFKDDIGNT